MNDINLGIEHHQAGRLTDAEVVYRAILHADPNHAEALHWLGVIAHQMGDNRAALDLITRAIRIDSIQPRYYSHLGMVHIGLKQFDEAVASLRQAIAMNPNFAEAYNNIGNVFRGQCKFKEAISNYKNALARNPSLVEAYKNIGDVLKMQGQTKEALNYYKKTMSIAPDTFSAHDAALSTAILKYLGNDLSEIAEELSIAQAMFGGISRESVASQTYCRYLQFLLSWWGEAGTPSKQHSDLETLYVIGESHSLSLQNIVISIKTNQYRCQAKWIEGCKQWHLANRENNVYKYQVSRIIASLPQKSTVLLTIGEIDCRHNLGIFPLWKKGRGEIRELIRTTVSEYLNFVEPLAASKKLRVIINGVPACNALLDELSAEDVKQFGTFLHDFNDFIKKSAILRGMAFLDVFALTETMNGFTTGTWHLDSHHLRPDAIKFAFDKHYIEPGTSFDRVDEHVHRQTTSLESTTNAPQLNILTNSAIKEPNMTIIKIDNKDYDLDTLSDEARAQLASLQFVDAELARLQAQAAAMQTARMAYMNALKQALPIMGGSDTIKFS